MKKIITLLFVIFSLTSAAQTDSTLFMLNEYGVDTTLIPHGFKVDSIKKLNEGTLKVFLSEIKVFGQKQRRKVLIYTGTTDAVDVDLEIDGLLIDETKTKSGRDFYEYFYKDWTAPVGVKNYTIYIIEKPYRLNNTIIEIKINETLVFQQFLQEELFKMSDNDIKLKLIDILGEDGHMQVLNNNCTVRRVIENEVPKYIKFEFYDQIKVDYQGIHLIGEHGTDILAIKFNKYFKLN